MVLTINADDARVLDAIMNHTSGEVGALATSGNASHIRHFVELIREASADLGDVPVRPEVGLLARLAKSECPSASDGQPNAVLQVPPISHDAGGESLRAPGR